MELYSEPAIKGTGNLHHRGGGCSARGNKGEGVTFRYPLTDVFNCEKTSLLKIKRGRHHRGGCQGRTGMQSNDAFAGRLGVLKIEERVGVNSSFLRG